MSASSKMKNHLDIPTNILPGIRRHRTMSNPDILKPFVSGEFHRLRTINRPDFMPGIEKMTDKVSADKTACAGNKTFHDIFLYVANGYTVG
jgi:hypothetical protein